jgi:hypothetical protein
MVGSPYLEPGIVLTLVIDIEQASVSPRWAIDYDALSMTDRIYDVKVVPLSSILRVSNRVVKVRNRVYRQQTYSQIIASG